MFDKITFYTDQNTVCKGLILGNNSTLLLTNEIILVDHCNRRHELETEEVFEVG